MKRYLGIIEDIYLPPIAHCVFLNRVPRNKILSFFNAYVCSFHVNLPSNRRRLLLGGSHSISA